MEVVVEAVEAEYAGGLMWAHGVAGIEERDEPDGRVRLIAGVPADHVDEVVTALDVHWPVTRGRLQPELWEDEWRAHARAARLDDGLVVQPPWIPAIAGPGDTEIALDPGRAWGHGAHPSTVLAANHLIALRLEGARVLDVGCGSGLLSVVAAIRGAAAVTGIDIDPAAVGATLANAAVNGVDDRVAASITPAEMVTGTYDVVAANIGLGVVRDLAPVFGPLVAPGGALVLSGLLDDQVDEAVAAYPSFVVEDRTSLDGWGAARLRRAARR